MFKIQEIQENIHKYKYSDRNSVISYFASRPHFLGICGKIQTTRTRLIANTKS